MITKAYNDDFNDFIKSIQTLQESKDISVVNANFINRNITIRHTTKNKDFSNVLETVNYFRLVGNLEVEFVDFETGNITVKHKKGALNITDEEIELLRNHKKIKAIISMRSRDPNLKLSEANYTTNIVTERLGLKNE